MNNPSAFPHYEPTKDGEIACWHGMTLRDYFAAKALASTLARLPLAVLTDKQGLTPELPKMTEQQGQKVREATAALAYQYADAMLTERMKGTEAK